MSTVAAGAPVARDDEWLSWPLRPLRAYRGSPLALGAALVFAYFVVAGLWYLTSGVFDSRPAWLGTALGLDLLYALSLGYLPVALLYVQRGTERDLARLAPLLDGPVERARRQVFAASPRALQAGLAAGLLMGAIDLWLGWVQVSAVSSVQVVAWFLLRELICDLSVFWVLAWLVVVAIRISRLAPGPERIRLLATDELSAFAHHGVRLALFTLLFWALWVPGIFFVSALLAGPSAAILAVGVAFSGVSLWLPTRGVRRSIRAAKQAELALVRRSIEEARGAALDAGRGNTDTSAARLPGLLAYEQRIAAVSESLIDARALGRIAIYLLIPLVSWIGGALVERVVDAALE